MVIASADLRDDFPCDFKRFLETMLSERKDEVHKIEVSIRHPLNRTKTAQTLSHYGVLFFQQQPKKTLT
jgi:hypothetical protein